MLTNELRLNQAPTIIKPSRALAAATQPRGKDGKATKITELELVLHVNVSDHLKALEPVFPGADVYCKLVAGAEKECKGEDRTARTKLPDADLRIWYGDDKEPVVSLSGCPVKSRLVLRVGVKGEATLVIKPRVKLSRSELGDVLDLLSGDCRLDMEPSQQTLPLASAEGGEAEDGGKKGKKGKGPRMVYSSEKGLVDAADGEAESAH